MKRLKSTKALTLLVCILMGFSISGINTHAAETWLWPVSGVTTLSRGYSSGHQGIDITGAGIWGHEIRASKSGTVTSSNSCPHVNSGNNRCKCNGGMGNYVIIDHGDGTRTRYMHMIQGSAIANGSRVKRGDVIGKVGSSGDSSGAHCHFDMWKNGVRVNNNPGNISYDYSSKTTHDPIGCVDTSSATIGRITVTGWAFDQDVPSTSIGVHVYVGGPAGSAGAEGHALTANKNRPDVAKAYSSLRISNYHGFSDTFTTKKTGTQKLYFYAINSGGGTNNPLIGTKTITIPKDTTKPTITNVKISNITATGYTISCTVTDNIGVTTVKFPTWTAKVVNGTNQDDLVWHTGSRSGNTWSYNVKISQHKNERSLYYTHIYAYDAAGNVQFKNAGNIYVLSSKSKTIPNGTYSFRSLCNTNYAISVNGNKKKSGANLHLWRYKASNKFEKWKVKYAKDGYYTITNLGSGLKMDVSGGKNKSGTNVWQYKANNSSAQLWQIIPDGTGSYYLIPKCGSGCCLDLNGAVVKNGQNIQIYNINLSKAQRWKITK